MWVRICLHSGGNASITQSWHTSERPESWKVCWILQPTPLVAQMGKSRPRKEGTCPGSSTWWQSELGDQGHLGFSSALPHPSKFLQLSGKGKELGSREDSNISRTQVGSGHSKYLIDGHYYQCFTLCRETQPGEGFGEAGISTPLGPGFTCLKGTFQFQAFASLRPTVLSPVILPASTQCV